MLSFAKTREVLPPSHTMTGSCASCVQKPQRNGAVSIANPPPQRETCASMFTYLPEGSYPVKVQEREAKLDGTFQLWKRV